MNKNIHEDIVNTVEEFDRQQLVRQKMLFGCVFLSNVRGL